LKDEVLLANDVSKARYIWRNGKYRKLPGGPLSFLFGSYFSLKTKLKVLRELRRKPSGITSTSLTVGDFIRQRFGQEILDYAVAPFVSGIYAGDVNQLLIHQTFKPLVEFAEKEGSVIRGMVKQGKTGGRRQSLTFKQGMEVLPQALAKSLSALRLNHKVESIEKLNNGSWQLNVNTTNGSIALEAEKVVFCVPAYHLSALVKDIYPQFSSALSKIYYPPMVAIHLAWKKNDIKAPLSGFGGLHPAVENRFTLGNIWTSLVFDGRCPEDQVLYTAFVGGVNQEAKYALDDDYIIGQVIKEQQSAYGINGAPTFTHIMRWPKGIPQYDQHQLAAQVAYEAIEKADNFTVSSNWLYGISLNDCIKKGRTLGAIL
jgi:oxygen-dependent protoporphyrinogen oxidase